MNPRLEAYKHEEFPSNYKDIKHQQESEWELYSTDKNYFCIWE